MNLGGDPSQALVHSNPSGKFTVALSSIDLGQGMKSVTRQICAETLGVPVEDVYVDTADSDTGPHCMGSFASRGTHRVGNAVMAAAKEARGVMMEAAAEELEVNTADLETDGRGNIQVKGAPHRSISTKDVAIAAQFKQGKTISGRGIFLVPLSDVDPETGEMSPATCYAHACLVAEDEVDDETGEDRKSTRLNSSHQIISYAVCCLKKNNCARAPTLDPRADEGAGGVPLRTFTPRRPRVRRRLQASRGLVASSRIGRARQAAGGRWM